MLRIEKSNKKGLSQPLDRNIMKSASEVNISSFAFLFSEIVQYSLICLKPGIRLEDRLHEMGMSVGYKVIELVAIREKANQKRETKILQILSFISQKCWKYLFGHTSDLLKGQESDDEYMINDKNLLLNKFISVPRDLEHINCGTYAAGVVQGILESAEFPANVSAHTTEDSPNNYSTTILIKFDPLVINRDKTIQSM
ncbi:transport protein particle component, Bet3 domain-containing protein [Cryptosporidium serpentis]